MASVESAITRKTGMSGNLCIRTLGGAAYHGLVLLLLLAGLAAIFLSRDLLYFRDFAILYDGAARMVSGQSPFEDFGMPTGPVSLFVPALAMQWFGPSWQVFEQSQMLINALILLSVTVLLVQLAERRPVILASQLILTFSYLILLTHPWYNTTALLLFFVTLNLSVTGGAVFACLAGFTTVLCLFTKQDFGGLAFISALACLGFRHFILQRNLLILLGRMGCYWWAWPRGWPCSTVSTRRGILPTGSMPDRRHTHRERHISRAD